VDPPISLLTTHSTQGFSSLLLMRVPLGLKPIPGTPSPKIWADFFGSELDPHERDGFGLNPSWPKDPYLS